MCAESQTVRPALQTENSTVVDRVFGVAAPPIWNDLPLGVVTSCTCFIDLQKHLETYIPTIGLRQAKLVVLLHCHLTRSEEGNQDYS